MKSRTRILVDCKYLICGDINKAVYKKIANFLFLLYASKRKIGKFCLYHISVGVKEK